MYSSMNDCSFLQTIGQTTSQNTGQTTSQNAGLDNRQTIVRILVRMQTKLIKQQVEMQAKLVKIHSSNTGQILVKILVK